MTNTTTKSLNYDMATALLSSFVLLPTIVHLLPTDLLLASLAIIVGLILLPLVILNLPLLPVIK